MSRIGKRVILIPANVQVTVEDNKVTAKGPKGELSHVVHPDLKVVKGEKDIRIEIVKDTKQSKALHGTNNALVSNIVNGVEKGFSKNLKLVGVGYRAALKSNVLELALGYSHPIKVEIPKGIRVEVPTNVQINISGIDKQQVGFFAAKVREYRKPEPYKGKGVLYIDEKIILKQGKTAKAKK